MRNSEVRIEPVTLVVQRGNATCDWISHTRGSAPEDAMVHIVCVYVFSMLSAKLSHRECFNRARPRLRRADCKSYSTQGQNTNIESARERKSKRERESGILLYFTHACIHTHLSEGMRLGNDLYEKHISLSVSLELLLRVFLMTAAASLHAYQSFIPRRC